MNNTTTPQAAPTGAVTAHYDFWNANPNGDKLFSVRAGVPLSDAFDQLSLLVGFSIDNMEILASEGSNSEKLPGSLWQQVNTLKFSYALIQSMHDGHFEHTKGKS